jgi:macrolide transport system ATP-binding/permease protein
MRLFSRLISLSRRIFRRQEMDRDLDDELCSQLELMADQKIKEGMTPQEARRAAKIELGGVEQVKEQVRAVRTGVWFDTLLQDVRFGLRMLRKNPSFTAITVLTLALAIGANTAIFSFMDSILVRQLPVRDPSSLVTLNWHSRLGFEYSMHCDGCTDNSSRSGIVADIFPYPVFDLFRRNDSLFSSVFAYCSARNLSLIVRGQADVAKGEYVSGDYFRTLGLTPGAGRLIIPDDDQMSATPVAVLSWGFSQGYFGGPQKAVGQSIVINNVPVVVVGVAPPEFFGVDPAANPDIYLPLQKAPVLTAASSVSITGAWYLDQNSYWVQMMARLRPGVTLAQAQAALAPQFHEWEETARTPTNVRAPLPFLVMGDGAHGLEALRDEYSKPLYVLMTLVGIILAIACANVAGLLLARGAVRRREMALRICVGAGRARVVRQLLTESVLLASFGGILGVLFAVWGIRFLTLLLANGRANFTLHAKLNWQVLAVVAALSLLTGIFFGLAPALQSTRVDVMPALKEVRAGQPHTRGRIGLRQILVVSQIALTLPMLAAAGLFVRTLSNLQHVELGFNRENLLLFTLNARQAGHQNGELIAFYNNLQQRFSAISGVRSVTLSASALIGEGVWGTNVFVSGKTINTRFLSVGPDYFRTMQVPIVLGRGIDERDQSTATPVAVINELFAKANFDGEDPIGQHLTFLDKAHRELEIVGVSKDTRYGELRRAPAPVVYFAYDQGVWPVDDMTYAVRTASDPLGCVTAIREMVHQADPRLPVENVRTQAAEIDQTMSQEITFAKLCTAFAILALTIACVGLYGTMSYDITRRTGEIGIRIALGAQRGDIVRTVLGKGIALVTTGTAIGLCASLGLTRLVASQLWGVSTTDPRTFAAGIAVITVVGLAACLIPTRRATKVDPMVALRHE